MAAPLNTLTTAVSPPVSSEYEPDDFENRIASFPPAVKFTSVESALNQPIRSKSCIPGVDPLAVFERLMASEPPLIVCEAAYSGAGSATSESPPTPTFRVSNGSAPMLKF